MTVRTPGPPVASGRFQSRTPSLPSGAERRREAYLRHVIRARRSAGASDTAAHPPTVAFYAIAAIVALLAALGLVMVLSASSVTSFHAGHSPWRYFRRQVIWAGVGLVCMLVTFKVPYPAWRRLAWPCLLLGLVAMLAPFAPGIGQSVNGARAWVALGSFGVQPSEFMKLAALLFCADLLARRSENMADLWKTLYPCLLVVFLACGLCLLQGDLGSAVVMACIVMVVVFMAGTPLVPVGLSGLAMGVTAAAFVFSSARRARRWTAFVDVIGNKDHFSYQTFQAMVSIANGGPTGVGVGASSGKWGYLPLAHSDFIFAIVAEELGLVGAVAVLGGFLVLTYFGVQVALACTDRFGAYLAGGVVSWFAVQTVINVGGVTGMLPVTGLTLPFISFGGSSLCASFAAAGLLLNVARRGL